MFQIISTIFAITCCIIPCVYCFKEGEALEEGAAWNTEWQRRRRRGPGPPLGPQGPMMGPPPPRMEERDVERGRRSAGGAEGYPSEKLPSHYKGPGGRDLSNREKREIQKWIRYVEGDDYE